MPTTKTSATLILKDGTKFKGELFGAAVNTNGEVVFNTGMMGYPESLTDPSYKGQILTFTYPMIGNYGVPNFSSQDENDIKKWFESNKIHLRGIIVSEYSQNHHHWNAKQSLCSWLKSHGIPGISGIDTRALTQKLREKGAMLGKIIIESKENEKIDFEDPNKENLVAQVCNKQVKHYKKGPKHVVIIDYGMKNNILKSFLKRNISITVVPWDHDFFEDENMKKFNGVFLSNGPGDPEVIKKSCKIVAKCLKNKIPTFGICMGNHILAMTAGAKTYKLKYGHRAQNQPCIDTSTNRCYITSQNHGYAVDAKTLPKDWELWFKNANDETVEGIRHKKLPFMSVQFHPEATPGPNDTNWLFDEFINKLK
ncbi:glutamine-hydrolyzing carbamoyl-phosphate synthase small subunit [Patescibacteria group bacterium]|nr:glutamine-hydrolyzing carbamoyl-phosphate synthase small subunit [Patescibacteria group bacterium]